MTVEQIIDLLQKHIGIQSADYSLAVARVDMPKTLELEMSLVQSRHTLALLQTLIGK